MMLLSLMLMSTIMQFIHHFSGQREREKLSQQNRLSHYPNSEKIRYHTHYGYILKQCKEINFCFVFLLSRWKEGKGRKEMIYGWNVLYINMSDSS